MIKAIVFDCFGVFYPENVCGTGLLQDVSINIISQLELMDDEASWGKIDRVEFVTKASKLLGWDHATTDRYFFTSDQRSNELLAYAQELRKSYKVALLSNIGPGMMDDFFSSEDLSSYFDTYVLSGEVKLAKPDPRIFELTCQRLGVEPSEAIMIDDVPEYCDGARSAGLSAVTFIDNDQLQRELSQLLR